MIFSGKRNIIFPDNTRKIIFQRDFFERPSFQNIWEKKIWLFFVECLKRLISNYYQFFTELQSQTRGWRQIDEIKRNRFFYGMVYSWFFAIFYQKISKFGFWLEDWVVAIKSKHFRDFLEIS